MADLNSREGRLKFLKEWGFKEIQRDSGTKLPWELVWRLMGTVDSGIGYHGSPANDFMALVNRQNEPHILHNRHDVDPYKNYTWMPSPEDSEYNGRIEDLLRPENRKHSRLLTRIPWGESDGLISEINNALLDVGKYGGFPFVGTAISTAVGHFTSRTLPGMAVSLLFEVGNMMESVTRVLARQGDELWHVEEIGYLDAMGFVTVHHINSIFIVDPYRDANAPAKAWLIHEDRRTLNLRWDNLSRFTPARMRETVESARQSCIIDPNLDQESLLDEYTDVTRGW